MHSTNDIIQLVASHSLDIFFSEKIAIISIFMSIGNKFISEAELIVYKLLYRLCLFTTKLYLLEL